jgi:hypothetical protein
LYFRDPHLINENEHCGLALFNIDTQTLEGLWEAVTFQAASQHVRARPLHLYAKQQRE